MENILHINEGPTQIMVEITPSTIENYVEMFGKRKTIKVCDLNKMKRIVKDITTFENKTKLTLYYLENGKEKRFGGMGFSIEGNISDPKFQSLISFLEKHLPSVVEWQDKANAKASTTTKEGTYEFPIAGQLNLLLYKHPNHSGERKMIVFFKLLLAFLTAVIPIALLLSLLFSKEFNLMGVSIAVAISLPFAFYSFKIFSINFGKGGLHKLFLNEYEIRINQGIHSTRIKLEDIHSLTYKIVELTIKQMNTHSKSTSMEYEFIINNELKFTMGENSAITFIKKAKELKIITEN